VRAAATTYSLDPNAGDTSLVDGSIVLPRGHSGVITLDPASGNTFARAHDAGVRVSLLACAITGIRAAHLALHLRLHRLPPLAVPRVLDLVARRHGTRIHVTWRTSIPARATTFDIVVEPIDQTHVVYDEIAGHGHSRFSIDLHVSPRAHARDVSIQVGNSEQSDASDATARIR
jgi:hypothetical protein